MIEFIYRLGEINLLKRTVTCLIFLTLFLSFLLPLVKTNQVKGTAPRSIKITNAATGLNSTTVGNLTRPLPPGGIPFALNISLNGSTTDLASWQVAITFDNNSLRCTNISIPESDPSCVFHGLQEIRIVDFSATAQNGTYTGGRPEIIAGGTLLDTQNAVSVNSALLCTMNFTAFKVGEKNQTTISFWPYQPATETFLWDSNSVDIPFDNESFSVNILASTPKLYIDPIPVNKNPGDVGSNFTVDVKIANVTNLYGFDMNITWDSTLITLNSFSEVALDAIWGAGHWYEALNASAPGSFKLVALSTNHVFTLDPGNQTLFTLTFNAIKSSNFQLSTPIRFAQVKLSDQNYTPIFHLSEDGLYSMSATVPHLEFVLIDPNPGKPFEYCKTFKVEVYATHIISQMTNFDLTIQFDSELLQFVDVNYWGVFGSGTYSNATGSVEVTTSLGTPQTGDRLLLFALTFHVEFDERIEHIWRTYAPHDLNAIISMKSDVGEFSFVEGTIPVTGITLPSPTAVTAHLIRGDVDCNGKVDVFDLRIVAAFYDQSTPVKYDLTMDGIIDIFDLVTVASNLGYGGP
jgi:hypothetical protein